MAGERILIVDDKIEITTFLTSLLDPLGYELITAMDGREGLARALAEQPDLVLLDVHMPGISGLEVLEALNRQAYSSPVILMTLYGSESVAVQALRLGVRNYINKPFDIHELLAAIDQALAEGRLRRERERLVAELSETNQKLTQRMRELTTLQAIGRSVASLMPQEDLLQRILDAAIYLAGADVAALFLLDGPGGQLFLEAVRSCQAYHADLADIVQDSYAQDVLQSGNPAWIPAPSKSTGVTGYLGQKANSLLYVPIRLAEEAIGVLGVAYLGGENRRPVEIENQLLALTDYAAIALKNAQLHEAMQETIAAQTLHDTVVTLSHYINNPLQALLGVSEMLRTEMSDGAADAIIGLLERKTREISVAISVLQEVASPESTIYLGSIHMIDIEAELHRQLAAQLNS